MENCIFCQIVRGQIPADNVYKDDTIAVFPSIDPKAPVHLIIIPTKHIEELEELDDKILALIRRKAVELVAQKGLKRQGYRLSTNGGAAKAVSHLHFHLLGGVAVDRDI